MYVRKWITIEPSRLTFETINRADIREGIEKYYLGRTKSNICLGRMTLEEGKIKTVPFFRTDILVVSVEGIAHFFVEPTGDIDFQDHELVDDEREAIYEAVRGWISENEDFWHLQKQFYFDRSKVDAAISGKSPEEAVEALKDLGY